MNNRRAKYCAQCGERLSEDDTYCPNCGAPVPEDTPSPAGSRRRKRLALIITAAAAIAALALGAGLLLANRLAVSPVARFLSYNTDLFTQRVLEPLEALDALHAPGQLDADFTVTGAVDNEGLNRYLNGSSLALQAKVDDSGALLGCKIDLLGSTVLNGAVTYENGRLGVYLPELDKNYYVLELAPAVREVTGQESDLSGPPLPAVSLAELRAALGPCWDAVTALMDEQNVTREKRVSGLMRVLPFDGACDVYAFRPSAQSLETLFLSLADILEQDGGPRELIERALSSAAVQLGVSGLGVGDLAGKLDGALTWAAGTLRDNAAAIAGQLADAAFTWSVAAEGDAVRQVRFSVTEPGTGAEKALVWELTGDGERERDEELYVLTGGDTRQVLSRHWESDGETVSGTLVLLADGRELLRVEHTSQDGRFSPLGLPYGSFTLHAAGLDADLSLTVADSAAGGTEHALTLSGIGGYTNGLFNEMRLTATAVEGSTVQPPSPAPVDVSDYSDEQIKEIINRMGRALRNDLLANLWPLLAHVW